VRTEINWLDFEVKRSKVRVMTGSSVVKSYFKVVKVDGSPTRTIWFFSDLFQYCMLCRQSKIIVNVNLNSHAILYLLKHFDKHPLLYIYVGLCGCIAKTV